MKLEYFESNGFTPKDAREFLQITQETLRYWRKKLYPISPQSHFTSKDIFIYRIIKELVYYQKNPAV